MRIRRKQKIDWYAGYLLIGIMLPLARLLGVLLRRDHSIDRPPARIVFIKLLGLGSLIVASDAIMAIRMRFPRARLILVTDTKLAAGIVPFGLFDEIRPIDTGRPLATLRGVTGFLLRAWRWRRLWVIDLEVYSKLTTVLSLLTLARNRFGFYLSYVPFRRFVNTHSIVFDQTTFLEDNYGKMASKVTGGIANHEAANSDASPADTNHEAANHQASPADTTSVEPAAMQRVSRISELEKPYILLNNTCSGLADARKLPDWTLAAVTRWILEHTAYSVALLGALDDRDGINRMIGSDPELLGRRERIVNYAGLAENFSSYYAFLRDKGVCLVTIDSGPLHIARKLGLPTVSVWGPTNPDNYLKIDSHDVRRHLYYYLKSPCSPCVHHYTTLPCGGNNFCMRNIPASAIIEKLQELLRLLATAQPA